MSSSSMTNLGAQLVRHRLIQQSELDACVHDLSASSSEPTRLLEELERRSLLTSYQVRQISKGEIEGLVLGDYKLEYRNAAGSFARVFRACSLKDGSMVGLKLLRRRWVNDPQIVSLFFHEAEVGKRLKHPNIVPIYTVESDRDFHFLTMEFIEGGNLQNFIAIRQRLSPVEAIRCALDICEGLKYAISLGITHRDLKLTNVLMSSQGVAKLVDFGLATIEGTQLARTDSFQRALEYGTLEKGTNAPTNDPRTDLYFVGTIFYELLTGVPPYPRTSDRDLRKDFTRYSMIRPIRLVDPNVPRAAEEIVERLLKVDPNQRYQSAADVIHALKYALRDLGAPLERPASLSSTSLSQPESVSGGLLKSSAKSTAATIMCVESRPKQQEMLRSYFNRHGFRVLVLSDLRRGIERLKQNPPDCVIFTGESISRDVDYAVNELSRLCKTDTFETVMIFSQQQTALQSRFESIDKIHLLTEPLTLGALRRIVNQALALQTTPDSSPGDSSEQEGSLSN